MDFMTGPCNFLDVGIYLSFLLFLPSIQLLYEWLLPLKKTVLYLALVCIICICFTEEMVLIQLSHCFTAHLLPVSAVIFPEDDTVFPCYLKCFTCFNHWLSKMIFTGISSLAIAPIFQHCLPYECVIMIRVCALNTTRTGLSFWKLPDLITCGYEELKCILPFLHSSLYSGQTNIIQLFHCFLPTFFLNLSKTYF